MGTTGTSGTDDFAALLAEFDKKAPGGGKRRVTVGDLVKGTIISLGRETVVVALEDGRTEGILDLVELVILVIVFFLSFEFLSDAEDITIL